MAAREAITGAAADLVVARFKQLAPAERSR